MEKKSVTQSHFPLQPRVYRQRPYSWWRTVIFLAIFLATMVGCLQALIGQTGSFGHKVVFVVLLLAETLCFGILLLHFLQSRLEVSAEGLTLYEVGFQIYTPWHQVERMAPVSHPFYWPHQIPTLLLRAPALLNRSISEGKQTGVAVIARHWIMQLLFVRPEKYIWFLPLTPSFVAPSDWERGALGAFLRQYAPWVLIGASEHAPEP